METSNDGTRWTTLADYRSQALTGSPLVIEKPAGARYVRLVFPENVKGSDLSFFEWAIR